MTRNVRDASALTGSASLLDQDSLHMAKEFEGEEDEIMEAVGEYEDQDAPAPTSWREIVRLHYKTFNFSPLWDIPGLQTRIEVAIDEFLERECTSFELRSLRF